MVQVKIKRMLCIKKLKRFIKQVAKKIWFIQKQEVHLYFYYFFIRSKLNKYNEDADICYNDNGIVDFNCNSFYHKDKHTDYDETSSCETHIGPGTSCSI